MKIISTVNLPFVLHGMGDLPFVLHGMGVEVEELWTTCCKRMEREMGVPSGQHV